MYVISKAAPGFIVKDSQAISSYPQLWLVCDPRHVHHCGSWFFEKSGTENPTLAYPFSGAGEILLPREVFMRIMTATFFGLVTGAICATGAFYGHLLKFSLASLIWILLNRAVMGFVIGATGLKLHWAWNGIVIGVVVGSIFSYFLFMTLGPVVVPPVNAVVNGIFGLVIEFFTTKVCKLPAFALDRKMESTLAA